MLAGPWEGIGVFEVQIFGWIFGTTSKSEDSWMYPGPNVPRHGKSLYTPYPEVEHSKYHGYTVRGTPNCPLTKSCSDEMIRIGRFFFVRRKRGGE